MEHWPLGRSETPPGWKLVPVGDVAESVQSGFASGRHSSDGGELLHLRPMNISPDGSVLLDDVRFVPADAGEHRLQRGDILFNNTNSRAWVGKSNRSGRGLKPSS